MSALLNSVFGIDDDYSRPIPTNGWATDVGIAALFSVMSLALVLTNRQQPELVEYLPLLPSVIAIVTSGVLLAVRRRFPVTVMLLLSGAHFIGFGIFVPTVASLASMQIVYFLGIYTAMAYARQRAALATSVLLVYASMALWLVLFDLYGRAFLPDEFQPNFWYYVATVLLNLSYFLGATWLGRNAWLQARDSHHLRESAETISRQADQLAGQAVVSERLRIARDLHDSVAHHISLIGIQTAAARRAMATRPEAATESLLAVEDMSRAAVADLRSLLGSLRDEGPHEAASHSLGAIEVLCRDASADGLEVAYSLVGDPADAESLTPAQLSGLVRVTQEALTNTRRHSTATEARVVVRIQPRSVELEITDNGRPVANTSGTGLGLVGMRERMSALGGTVETGPRSTQGYRVLARFPRSSS